MKYLALEDKDLFILILPLSMMEKALFFPKPGTNREWENEEIY